MMKGSRDSKGPGLLAYAKGLDTRTDKALGIMIVNAGSIARQLCPVRTGFLRDSIFALSTGLLEWALGASAWYAEYVEFGTLFTAAQPFILPAIEAVKGMFAETFRSLASV